MRKILGYVAVAVSVFALALAALLAWVVPSHAVKTPLNLDITLYGTGSGTYFDPNLGKDVQVELRTVRHVRTDADASDSNVIVADQGICIMRAAAGRRDCSFSPKQLVDVVTERIAADRVSSESVKGYRSAADGSVVSQLNGKNVQHVGLTLKFPFYAKKHSYQFWDYNLLTSAEARYSSSTKVDGLTAYRYDISVPRTKVELIPGTQGYYTDTKTLYVEPTTGTILKSFDHQVKTFLNGQVAADFVLQTADESVHQQGNEARKGIDQINQVSETLPIVLLAVGIVLGVVAFVLLRGASEPGSSSSGHRAARQPQPAATG